MSWLSKVTDIAGAAESLLNKIDEKTSDAIQTARESRPRTRMSSTASVPPTAISIPENVVTEDYGRPAQSIPSRAHSDYTGGGWKPRNAAEQSSSSSHVGAASAAESWTMVLNSKEVTSSSRDDDTRSRRSSGGRSAASIRTANGSEAPGNTDLSQLRSQLFAKDSQITVMKTKLVDIEKRLEKRSQDYYEMKADKEMLEKRVSTQHQIDQNSDSLEELKLARKKAQEQKEQVIEECNQMKRKVVSLEEEIRAMVEQLRLAKFNLNENKKEFDEYKTKAQKILSAKEKLVESLKTEQGIGANDRPGHLLQAEVEEIRVERDLARSDLESSQLQVYTLRSDMEELEVQIRDLQSQVSEQRRNQLEERQTWESTVALLNEKVECSRIEGEFAKQEIKRQNDLHVTRIHEKEAELRRTVEEARARRREEESRNDNNGNAQLGEMLLQKQQELEDALRTNQVLSVRLDRLQKATSARETSITMEPTSTSSISSSPHHQLIGNVSNEQARHALQAVDSAAFKMLSMLRSYPAARLFFVAYFIAMHLWLFFIVLTYTPEMH